jgi:ribonuclease T1
MAQQRTRSQWLAALIVVLVVGALWLWDGHSTSPADRPAGQPSAARTHDGPSPTGSGSSRGGQTGRDPESGLPWIQVGALPAQARQTLQLIDDGGPYPYDRDGVVFGNFEGVLPQHQRGYYHEYTVPTPGESDRGARRIVTGGEDEFFYTGDHYASFERIAR